MILQFLVVKTCIRIRIETNAESDPGSGSTLKPMQDHYSGAGITGFEYFIQRKCSVYIFGKFTFVYEAYNAVATGSLKIQFRN
jgi:hypothetical protein